jgi:serine/threonine protein kinase HipA of HipAB toxin-antitoxin module
MQPHADDLTIPDEEVLWRRISPESFREDPQTGIIRASDSAFRTGSLSVHIASLADKKTILEKYPTERLTAFTAGAARKNGCIVMRAPEVDDPSHALVLRRDNPGGRLSGGQAMGLRKAAVWVD